jgi:hypothetical protein
MKRESPVRRVTREQFLLALPRLRLFVDERRGGGVIRLTDEMFWMGELAQSSSLPNEVEARWRLVETAWELGLPKGLVVGAEGGGEVLTISRAGRRAPVARSRDALNGYQKGKCFYCFSDVSVATAEAELADVDHFFPRILLQTVVNLPIDGVWNLVLCCRRCNRGVDGKSARLPERTFLERLNTRNEFLIRSHHPLRETLIAQTGGTRDERARFLNSVYDASWGTLIHTWKPRVESEAAF